MNKEEIEKAKQCLEETIKNTYAEGKAIKLDNLREYIEQLENKVSILDKVTDKLEIASSKYIEEYKKVENLILIDGNTAVLQELSCIIYNLEEILNIIKGETEEKQI